jgi:uncharacterized protein involved in exopolysaccharide biosynthesis
MSDLNLLENVESNSNSEQFGHQIDFYYLFGTLYRYKTFLILFTTSAAILSIIYVLVVTPVYQSQVTMYPMNKEDDGLLKQLAVTLGISNKTSGFYIVDVLESRRISKEVIFSKYKVDEFKDSINLIEFWGFKDLGISENRILELTLRTLKNSIDIREDKETSLVSLKVNTKDKFLSKQIADKYCEKVINYLNYEVKNSIRESIKFSEIRLVDVHINLKQSEQELVEFQSNNAKASSPSFSMELKKKYQDVELLQNVVVLLEKQLELLKIEEVKDKPIVNILDQAEIHDKPIEPQKRRVVMVNTIIAFFLAYTGVILKEKTIKYKVIDKFKSELRISRNK